MIQSNWKRDQSNEAQENKWKVEEWSSLLFVVTDVLLETMINLARNKASNERWERDRTYFSAVTDAPIETTIYPKSKKWSKSDWAYFSILHRCFNWDKDLYKDKEGIEWKIEVIELTFRWSSISRWRHRSIHQETKEWIKHWRMMELTSQSWTMIQSNWDNDSSRRKQGIEWDSEGRSNLPLSDDRRIELNGDNYQPRARNKDLNESLLSDQIYFSGTAWVLYSMWCNERWLWVYINFWFLRLILHCPPVALFRRNHSISVNLVHERHSLFLPII